MHPGFHAGFTRRIPDGICATKPVLNAFVERIAATNPDNRESYARKLVTA
jgi:hypothetical protein